MKGKIWVKIPTIQANGTTEIELRYGNSNTLSQSDGNATFELFDDFEDNLINTEKWTIITSNQAEISEHNGKIILTADANSRDSADLISKGDYAPNVTIEFEANISAGQGGDYKGLGFLSTNVGANLDKIGEAVYWRGQEYNLYAQNKYLDRSLEDYSSACKLIENDYEPKSCAWKLTWMNPYIEYYLNGTMVSSHKVKNPISRIPARFSINTTGSSNPVSISLDWIYVRKCAVPEPNVEIQESEEIV
jgi:hypothetical protein